MAGTALSLQHRAGQELQGPGHYQGPMAAPASMGYLSSVLPTGCSNTQAPSWGKCHPVTACPCHCPPHQWHILPSELLYLLPNSLCAPLAKMVQVQQYQHQHFWEMNMTAPRSLNSLVPALSITDHWFLSRRLLAIMSKARPDTTLPNLPRERPDFTWFENNYIPPL